MPITTYDLLPSMEVIAVSAAPGLYPASGTVSDCVTNTGWWENYSKSESELRVAPTDAFMKAARAKLRFTAPDLTGVDPGRVRLRLRGNVAWDGEIRDPFSGHGDIGDHFSFTVASSNAYSGVNGSFGRIRVRGESTLPGEINVRKTSTKNYDSLGDFYQETNVDTPYFAEGLTLIGGSSFDELLGYYTNGTDPESFPAQFFDGGTTSHTIDLDVTFYTGYPTAAGEPSVEWSYNINQLEVFLEVDADTIPIDEYLPISGECGVIESRYFNAGPGLGLTFPSTNDEWTVDYTATAVTEGLRWSVTFTALTDLPYGAFVALGGTITSDGGVGAGPAPTGISATSYANSPAISGVSGVSLDAPVSYAGSAGVAVSGGGTFSSGDTFTMSFTVPNEFPTHLGLC
jgi:hypothetical protein